MRLAVLIIAGVQLAVLAYIGLTGTIGSDPAGNAMAHGFVTLAGIAMAVCLVPALILAISQRAQKLALLLSLLPLVVLVLLFARA